MEKKAKKKIAGFIDAALVKEARVYAARTEDSINGLLAKTLREYLDNHKLDTPAVSDKTG